VRNLQGMKFEGEHRCNFNRRLGEEMGQ
jgi:hypothetical protein